MIRQDLKNTHVYIIHGYMASTGAHWFPWLKDRLSNANIPVTVFDMPHSNNPSVAEWDLFLDENILQCHENTYFVCHSLGCIALLRYLSRNLSGQKVGGIILVSGFAENLPNLPQLNSFTKQKLDLQSIIELLKHRCVIASQDDPIVDYKYSVDLSKRINANLETLKNGKHFLAVDGYTEFPLVFNEIIQLIHSYSESKTTSIAKIEV